MLDFEMVKRKVVKRMMTSECSSQRETCVVLQGRLSLRRRRRGLVRARESCQSLVGVIADQLYHVDSPLEARGELERLTTHTVCLVNDKYHSEERCRHTVIVKVVNIML